MGNLKYKWFMNSQEKLQPWRAAFRPAMSLPRTALTILLLGFICSRGLGQVVSPAESPTDDITSHDDYQKTYDRPELRPLEDEYNQLIRVRLSPLKLVALEPVVYPKTTPFDADAPSHRAYMDGFKQGWQVTLANRRPVPLDASQQDPAPEARQETAWRQGYDAGTQAVIITHN